jgi:hypothetical protein
VHLGAVQGDVELLLAKKLTFEGDLGRAGLLLPGIVRCDFRQWF